MTYNASSIRKLKGLEAVRERPGMYLGSVLDGSALHHLIKEVVDNSVDEHLAGVCTRISVVLEPNGYCTVMDDGRGIPVDIHPEEGVSALQLVLCDLHAGGKFGHASYESSAGLHGVGVSAVNAVSEELEALVDRDGQRYRFVCVRGIPVGEVQHVGPTEHRGTTIRWKRDLQIFEGITEYDRVMVKDRLQELAFLNPGLSVCLTDSRGKKEIAETYQYSGGIRDYMAELVSKKKVGIAPLYFTDNLGCEICFCWVDAHEENTRCYANNTYNRDGGTHLTGFKNGLSRVVAAYAKEHGLLRDLPEDGLTGADIREGVVAIVNVRVADIAFSNQTKDKLITPKARAMVEGLFADQVSWFLKENPGVAKKIADRAVVNAKAREAARRAREGVQKKEWGDYLSLPGKLADCQTKDPAQRELFLVEGDSAGGCHTGDTLIRLADSRIITLAQVAEENRQGKTHFVYSYDSITKRVVIGRVSAAWKTKRARVLTITLDNGKSIRATPDHPYLLRSGKWVSASELQAGDSLMPLKTRHQEYKLRRKVIKRDHPRYEWVTHPGGGSCPTHWLADEWNIRNGVYADTPGEVSHRHHLDENPFNNDPTNIVRVSQTAHLAIHSSLSVEVRNTAEYRQYMSKKMLTLREELSERGRKQWEDKAYAEYMREKWKEHYLSNQEYRNKLHKRLHQAQAEYWAVPQNRELAANRTKRAFEKNPERKETLRSQANAQWEDPALRSWRAAKTREQWTPEFREKRAQAQIRNRKKISLELLNEVGLAKYAEARQGKEKKYYKLDTLLSFYGGETGPLSSGEYTYNHRVVSVSELGEDEEDVYDLEVEEFHNFAVEAGVFVHNSAKGGRDRVFQAILPLRGKVLNVDGEEADRILENKEIGALISVLGCGIVQTTTFDLKKLKYHKVVILTDADVDGAHIRTLLLTFFYRCMPQLIDAGHLYVAQPPLYGVKLAGRKSTNFLLDDPALEAYRAELTVEQRKTMHIQRYKGLGEMNAVDLWHTTLNPENRVLKRVEITDAVAAERYIGLFMSDDVASRREWIEENGQFATDLDI